jgi:hypothetical protein
MTHERQRFDDEHNHDIHDSDAAVDDPGFLEDQLLAFHYSDTTLTGGGAPQ